MFFSILGWFASILGDEDDVYWDDADLVSSKWDDATIASIDPDSPETIGDLKQRIKLLKSEEKNKVSKGKARFGIEAEVLKKFNTPNVVKVFDHFIFF